MSDLDSAPTKSYSNLLNALTSDGDEAETLVLPTPTEVVESQPSQQAKPAVLALEDKAPVADVKATLPAAEKPQPAKPEEKITDDMMKMAIANYAEANKLDAASVTEADIYATGKAIK